MSITPYTNVVENVNKWPLSRKLSLDLVVLLSILLFAAIILRTSRADYMPLYVDLPQEEAASVTSWLREEGIPYQLRNNGRSIYVPFNMVHETRLNLAGAGLPRQSGVGFEIFDKQNFGVTQFTQKINYQRALQGELARTIVSLDAVTAARVHLVIPEQRLLQSQQELPKASVVVDLAAGRTLDAAHTQGIIHLVAGSIGGLKENQVTVVDTNGNMLSRSTATDPGLAFLPETLNFRNKLESRLETRAQSLLDKALGPGNAIVRVTADLDFTREAITSEEYDPDSLVPRSEQVTKSQSGERRDGGVPGVEANLGGNETDENFGGVIPSTRSSEITNYEISKTVRQISSEVGRVKTISAAVLVADKYEPGAGGQPGAYVPRAPEEIDAIQRMMTHAIGLEPERGDRIEVTAMPFRAAMMQMGPGDAGSPGISDFLPWIRYLLLGIGALVVYMLLLRPVINTLKSESVAYNKTVYELEEEAYAPEKKPLDAPARLRLELAESAVTPTQVIKTWLKES